jgi:hypothetical protein
MFARCAIWLIPVGQVIDGGLLDSGLRLSVAACRWALLA